MHHRRSIRLPNADYAADGTYFVTICTQNRQCVFGTISDEIMLMNAWGKVALACWSAIPEHFPFIALGASVVMPNHIHGIVVIGNDEEGAVYRAPTERSFAPLPKGSLHIVVNTFKGAVSRQIHRLKDGEAFQWQRNYYEHIIRTEDDYERIHAYILSNPQKWKDDQLWME